VKAQSKPPPLARTLARGARGRERRAREAAEREHGRGEKVGEGAREAPLALGPGDGEVPPAVARERGRRGDRAQARAEAAARQDVERARGAGRGEARGGAVAQRGAVCGLMRACQQEGVGGAARRREDGQQRGAEEEGRERDGAEAGEVQLRFSFRVVVGELVGWLAVFCFDWQLKEEAELTGGSQRRS
jgi:hypothetical protein